MSGDRMERWGRGSVPYGEKGCKCMELCFVVSDEPVES